MKKNRKQRVLALALSSAMILSMAVPAMAESESDGAKEPITLAWNWSGVMSPDTSLSNFTITFVIDVKKSSTSVKVPYSSIAAPASSA